MKYEYPNEVLFTIRFPWRGPMSEHYKATSRVRLADGRVMQVFPDDRANSPALQIGRAVDGSIAVWCPPWNRLVRFFRGKCPECHQGFRWHEDTAIGAQGVELHEQCYLAYAEKRNAAIAQVNTALAAMFYEMQSPTIGLLALLDMRRYCSDKEVYEQVCAGIRSMGRKTQFNAEDAQKKIDEMAEELRKALEDRFYSDKDLAGRRQSLAAQIAKFQADTTLPISSLPQEARGLPQLSSEGVPREAALAMPLPALNKQQLENLGKQPFNQEKPIGIREDGGFLYPSVGDVSEKRRVRSEVDMIALEDGTMVPADREYLKLSPEMEAAGSTAYKLVPRVSPPVPVIDTTVVHVPVSKSEEPLKDTEVKP